MRSISLFESPLLCLRGHARCAATSVHRTVQEQGITTVLRSAAQTVQNTVSSSEGGVSMGEHRWAPVLPDTQAVASTEQVAQGEVDTAAQ